jgi:quinol monooxygenase YgiN
MCTRRLWKIGGAVLALLLRGGAVAEEPRAPYVRIAELEIAPAQLESYKAAVKEAMEASVRVKSGVMAIYAVAEKDFPSRLRFFEMRADEAAYKAQRDGTLQDKRGRYQRHDHLPPSDRGSAHPAQREEEARTTRGALVVHTRPCPGSSRVQVLR